MVGLVLSVQCSFIGVVARSWVRRIVPLQIRSLCFADLGDPNLGQRQHDIKHAAQLCTWPSFSTVARVVLQSERAIAMTSGN